MSQPGISLTDADRQVYLKFIEWRSEATTPLDEKGLNEVVGPAKKCDAVIVFVGL